MHKTRRQAILLVALLCLGTPGAGCGALGPYMSNNVPLYYQKQQIQRFDPYPDQDIGPAMVGVRPPDFSPQIPAGERSFLGLKRPQPLGL